MAKDSDSSTTTAASAVVVRPQALCTMILHAMQHSYEEVHGMLWGSWDSTTQTLRVEHAVPIAHSTPTVPLLETALALLENDGRMRHNNNNNNNNSASTTAVIVGWYMAPMLLQDRQAGPVAMRLVSQLDSQLPHPVTLVVVNNAVLGSFLLQNGTKDKDDDVVRNIIQAHGKDFGQQFQQAIATTTVVEEQEACRQALRQAQKDGISCPDLEDHLLDPSSSVVWYPNQPLTQLVDSMCQDTI